MNSSALQDRRVWLGGGAAVALLIVVASWFLLINPELSSAADLRSQADDAQTQNTALQVKINDLAKKDRDIGTLRTKLATALDSLPPTTGLPSFTNELALAAHLTGVNLRSIAVGTISPVGVSGTAGAPAPAASSAPAAGSGQTSASTATPAAAPAADPGQYSIAVTVSTAGSAGDQAVFLKALQDGPRRVLVTSTNMSYSGTHTTMTTQVTVYTAPMTRDQLKALDKTLTSN